MVVGSGSRPVQLWRLLVVFTGCCACTGRSQAPQTPLSLTVRDGRLLSPYNREVGRYTSSLQSEVLSLFPEKGPSDWADTTLVKQSVSAGDGGLLRHLYLEGEYFADMPLRLPSLLVLHLNGSITDAANLTADPFNGDSKAFPGIVMLNGSQYSAIEGGTVNATAHPKTQMQGVAILQGHRNSLRGVRALSNWQSAIGVRGGSNNEIVNCDVGGDPKYGNIAARAIWSIATERNYVHHNYVHHADMHALDFDAYTASSIAWANTCEDNGAEGIFVEETSHDNVITGNICRRNRNGIGVYTLAVGPVTRNVFFGNQVEENTNNAITAGGYGHDPTKYSIGNVFFGNVASKVPEGNAAFNVAHGANKGDYWFGNAVQGGNDEFDLSKLPHNNSKVAIFQPGHP